MTGPEDLVDHETVLADDEAVAAKLSELLTYREAWEQDHPRD